MKIGIEAQRIFRRKKHGMDMVVLELIRHLQQVDKVNEYFILYAWMKTVIFFAKLPTSISSNFGRPYPAGNRWFCPAAARHGCDVFALHEQHGPLFCRVPVVITLHDIIYMESSNPEADHGGVVPTTRNWQRLPAFYRTADPEKSRKIITVSDYEKK